MGGARVPFFFVVARRTAAPARARPHTASDDAINPPPIRSLLLPLTAQEGSRWFLAIRFEFGWAMRLLSLKYR